MERCSHILFDLDGTLTDSAIGIANSFNYALQKLHIPTRSKEELQKFIGPPLLESFERGFSLTKNEAKEAVAYYREYFKAQGIYENTVYETIPDLLKQLNEIGVELIVATSKLTVDSVEILKNFQLSQYFSLVVGSELDGSRAEKSEVIRYILEHSSICEESKPIMVGDREHDVLGARENGILAVAVTYGYGTREMLEKAKPDYIVNSVNELAELLLYR